MKMPVLNICKRNEPGQCCNENTQRWLRSKLESRQSWRCGIDACLTSGEPRHVIFKDTILCKVRWRSNAHVGVLRPGAEHSLIVPLQGASSCRGNSRIGSSSLEVGGMQGTNCFKFRQWRRPHEKLSILYSPGISTHGCVGARTGPT